MIQNRYIFMKPQQTGDGSKDGPENGKFQCMYANFGAFGKDKSTPFPEQQNRFKFSRTYFWGGNAALGYAFWRGPQNTVLP